MKKGNLITGIMYVLVGVLLLIVAILTDSRLDNLLLSFGGAGIAAGIMMIYKYFYWSKPGNRERYAEKINNERIEQHDELKEKLRDMSGRYSYVFGLIVISISILIFSILGALEIIGNSRIIVLYLSGYLLLQIIIGIGIFKHLLEKYK